MPDRHKLHIMPPDFDSLSELVYIIAATDCGSGLQGTFAYDVDLYAQGCGMWAIGPVFEDVMEFYSWAKTKGFRYHDLNKMLTLSRTFT